MRFPARLSTEQKIQEVQYAFPYHHVPRATTDGFAQHIYWSWGFRYLGGIKAVKDLCESEDYESLLDIGCGDGRFIADLAHHGTNKRLRGVDYSDRAIALAKALHPEGDYIAADISSEDLGGEKFDVVTLIEVLEHIPPPDLPDFVARCASFLRPGGRIVVTVPHKNKPLNPKHFQHFDSDGLRNILRIQFEDIRFRFLDASSRLLQLWLRLLGGRGEHFVVTWGPALQAFYDFYLARGLYADREANCARLACVARKPPETL